MPTERSTRVLIAAILFVLAVLLAVNYLVDARPLPDWWLPLLVFALGALLLFANRRGARVKAPSLSAQGAYTVRDYTFEERVTPPTLTRGEQPGEVNVQEPRDEEESQDPIPAPETLTPPAAPDVSVDVPEVEPLPERVPAAPETLTPPEEPDPEEEVIEEMNRVTSDDQFAPPASAEGFLNPPTQSDTLTSASVEYVEPVQDKDPARSEMPLSHVEVEKPARSQEQRLREDKGALLQPQDTAENEFQSGEHVAHNQPTQMPPPPQTTTGEGFGEGIEAGDPAQKTVLDKMSAPTQPDDREAASEPTRPDVADAVMSGREDDALREGIAPSDVVSTTPASGAAGAKPDDLTVISGIGKKMAAALRTAGIDSYTKLAGATDDQLRDAISAAGMRFAPSLETWREQASFLARGDRAGFQALLNSMRDEENRGE